MIARFSIRLGAAVPLLLAGSMAQAAPVDMICKGSGTNITTDPIRDFVLQIDLDGRTATFTHPDIYGNPGPKPIEVSDLAISWSFEFTPPAEYVRKGFQRGIAQLQLNRVTGRLSESVQYPPYGGAGTSYECQRVQRLL